LNAHKHRHPERATRGWLRLRPKWQAVRSGPSNVARRERSTAGVQSGPKSILCRMQNMEKLPAWDHAVRGHFNRKAGEQEQHGDDRKSQGRDVMFRICPRRSGLEWQERMRNRLNREMQMTSNACCLVRPGAVLQWSAAQRPQTRLPSCPRGLRCTPRMHQCLSNHGSTPSSRTLERPEPCEGKLSRTVLRGA